MYNVEEILQYGKTGSRQSNSTLAEAVHLKNWFAALGVPVGEIKVLPVGLGPNSSGLISLSEIEGEIPDNVPLHLQLEVAGQVSNVKDCLTWVKVYGPWDGLKVLGESLGFRFDPLAAPAVNAVVRDSVVGLWRKLG